MAQVLGGGVLVFGLYIAWRRVEVAQQGQVTDRFTRAIEQLGSERDDGTPKWELRLGGIYALERIARDSKRDHWPVMEILTTYVRENAPARVGGQGCDERDPQPQVRADIQAVLIVLGRRVRNYEEDDDLRLDLFETDLRRYRLVRAHLEGAMLWRARLEQANLYEAHLEGADLSGAHLDRAALVRTHLERAVLQDTSLGEVFLADTHLEGANLQRAYLRRAQLGRVYLDDANLDGADLQGTDLHFAIGLTAEQVEGAIKDEYTILPDYLARGAREVPE